MRQAKYPCAELHCDESSGGADHDFCPKCKSRFRATQDMNARARLLFYMQEKTERMVKICEAKNADYSGASEDPFANFARVESLGICKAEIGFLTRMTDKLCRITSFAASGTLMVKDESVEDTLLDLANYCLLLGAYLAEKKLQEKETGK